MYILNCGVENTCFMYKNIVIYSVYFSNHKHCYFNIIYIALKKKKNGYIS